MFNFCTGDDSLETTIATLGNTPNMSQKTSVSNSNTYDAWAVHVELTSCDVMNSQSSSPYVVKLKCKIIRNIKKMSKF